MHKNYGDSRWFNLLQIIAYILLLSRSCLQAVPFAPSTSLGGSFLVPVLESSSTLSSDGSAGGLSTSSSTASSPSSCEESSAEGTFWFSALKPVLRIVDVLSLVK